MINDTKKLLSIQGRVTVHFLDGQTLSGEIITQDKLHIFLEVDHEPVQIPRQQIRFIKGQAGQPIAETTEIPVKQGGSVTPIQENASPLQAIHAQKTVVMDTPKEQLHEREITATRNITPPQPSEVAPQPLPDDDSSGTILLLSPLDEGTATTDLVDKDTFRFASADELDEDESDGTVVLPLTEAPTTDVPAEMYTPDEYDTGSGATMMVGDMAAELEQPEKGDATHIVGSKQADTKPLKAKLVCTAGPHVGQIFYLADEAIIGRASTNQVALVQDKEISRRHAIIRREANRFSIEDQNSLNGTFVNEQSINGMGKRYLQDGDTILVGVSGLEYQEE